MANENSEQQSDASAKASSEEGLVRLADSAGFSQPQQYFSHAKSAQPPANQPANSIFLSREISQPASRTSPRSLD